MRTISYCFLDTLRLSELYIEDYLDNEVCSDIIDDIGNHLGDIAWEVSNLTETV